MAAVNLAGVSPGDAAAVDVAGDETWLVGELGGFLAEMMVGVGAGEDSGAAVTIPPPKGTLVVPAAEGFPTGPGYSMSGGKLGSGNRILEMEMTED